MKRKGPRRNVEKQRFWQHAVQDQASSGKSIRQYCRDKNLSEPSFYAWRQEIKRRGSQTARTPSRPRTTHAAFVPVEIAAGLGLASIECLLPSGIVLRLPAAMEPAAIAAVLCAWEQSRC